MATIEARSIPSFAGRIIARAISLFTPLPVSQLMVMIIPQLVATIKTQFIPLFAAQLMTRIIARAIPQVVATIETQSATQLMSWSKAQSLIPILVSYQSISVQ